MATPLYQQAKVAFDKGGLPAVFLEVLGWDSQPNEKETFLIDKVAYVGTKVASVLSGIVVFEFDFQEAGSATPSQQKEIAKAVGKKYAERLVVFKSKSKSTWLWPKKTSGGALTFEKLDAPNDSLPTFLAQRLIALSISNEEFDKGVTLPQIREKLRGSFDTSTVTKKFYERFRNQHQELAKSISGLNADQSHSYATLLLNRLMFIYFLQKKEFLNEDANYLRNCLNKVSALKGDGKFFSFYKDLLLELFFEGLNKKDGEFKPAEIASIIGKVPYINGGIFGESELEQANEISVPDETFADIFNFFDSFTWHLDTRPTGKSDEINPEVIGYIFEQYINFTAGGKKENGAYYTKQDVTGYMVGQTLVPRLLDSFVEIGLNPLQLAVASGDRYIYDSMLHGWDALNSQWIQIDGDLNRIWEGDPIGWVELDKCEHNPLVSLPGESLVESLHRRNRVDTLRGIISNGSLSSVNDLISFNLNSELLLLDAIDLIDDESDFEEAWTRLENLSVIDPTCGSGAFLFAALEVLEDSYSHLLDVAEELSSKSKFASGLVAKVAEHANRRYFIRKQAALNNIYGTDLMSDAIETAKLRVFLALASCLDSTSEIEPLPDLDFNLKPGNLVVGFKDASDFDRVGNGQLIGSAGLDSLQPKISQYIESYKSFVLESVRNKKDLQGAKVDLLRMSAELRTEANRIYAQTVGLNDQSLAEWIQEKKPFHWFTEFPQIISAGGFDVVIGNPPYIKKKEIEPSDIRGYLTSNTPDFYAVCYERSLQLLSNSGRHAFIVMLSLASGESFSPLRDLFSRAGYQEWWSTYAKRPDSLFAGVQVRNTILLLGPSQRVPIGAKSTMHNVFKKETRAHLFTNLEYGESKRSRGMPVLRGGVATELAQAIFDSKNIQAPSDAGHFCYIRGRGQYWYPVLPGKPSVINSGLDIISKSDPTVGKAALYEGELDELVIPALGGKLSYLWWSATGDDFNTLASASYPIRCLVYGLSSNTPLLSAGRAVLTESYKHAFGTVNAGSIQANIRWTSLRSSTDIFDKLLLDALGLAHLWRPLNVWYRQAMKSQGSNLNSFTVPLETAKIIFDR